jgi:hypothetical protein
VGNIVVSLDELKKLGLLLMLLLAFGFRNSFAFRPSVFGLQARCPDPREGSGERDRLAGVFGYSIAYR